MVETEEITITVKPVHIGDLTSYYQTQQEKPMCTKAVHLLHTMVVYKDGHSPACTACILECTRVH